MPSKTLELELHRSSLQQHSTLHLLLWATKDSAPPVVSPGNDHLIASGSLSRDELHSTSPCRLGSLKEPPEGWSDADAVVDLYCGTESSPLLPMQSQRDTAPPLQLHVNRHDQDTSPFLASCRAVPLASTSK